MYAILSVVFVVSVINIVYYGLLLLVLRIPFLALFILIVWICRQKHKKIDHFNFFEFKGSPNRNDPCLGYEGCTTKNEYV